MSNSSLSFSLQVFPVGDMYYAVLEAGTPYGLYRISTELFASARTRQAAVRQVCDWGMRLANWKGSRYRGVGRKPRNYWPARHVAELLRHLGLVSD